MSGATRIFAFAFVLGAVFVVATTVGRAVGPVERGASGGSAQHGLEMAPEGPAGLAVAEGGLRLTAARKTLAASRPQPFSFRILRAEGTPLLAYDVEHERRMHVIVARRDLTGFQHLHPTFRADGTWQTTVAPLDPGAYRVFADFASGGRRVTLGVDVTVPGASSYRRLPSPTGAASSDDYLVSLSAPELGSGEEKKLSFGVARRGREVQVDAYLGARGHLVILREGDLGYLHVHAEEDALEFDATFPSPGRYRAFLQFAHAGRVRTVAFTLVVPR